MADATTATTTSTTTNPSSASPSDGAVTSTSSSLPEAGQRGSLVIKDRVVTTIAEAAASRVPSVLRSGSHLNPLSRSLPHADVTLTPSHARVSVDIATSYDRPLYEVAGEVREAIATAVATYTSMTVDAVNVTVTSVRTDEPRVDDVDTDGEASSSSRHGRRVL
ncbi:Asp23/Gls24 family envelope stress response protein [Terracoccus luteus]|uniref:Putative alkaline shock family protein YloU n=1 Tax=Terracoccus luteus TaxID=53356 RepID=A0A495Y380_9MICO|nr:Asp23/Gls24 family envelope stress response protein [Terracoccus luteus]MBB2988380.1 putative alkaline shock family protein YloU [Terracoccus luteus]MCP2173990.1 putative alkaline shock family protein YloU [Terracoccus luteus]RKT79503.1 putative alkaline shock family protein YloU [Terracoccus luteus]